MIAAGVLLTLVACGTSTDADHRAEVEALLGHQVPDWPAYRDTAQRRCLLDRATFQQALTGRAHGRDWLAVKTDVRVLCPHRAQEVADWERSHGPVPT